MSCPEVSTTEGHLHCRQLPSGHSSWDSLKVWSNNRPQKPGKSCSYLTKGQSKFGISREFGLEITPYRTAILPLLSDSPVFAALLVIRAGI